VNDSLYELSNKLNYQFKNTALLELALTHRSASSVNNERLEYLGDAVLGFVVAESLYQKYADASEGILTRQRASLVKKETLANLAKELDLGKFLYLGTGEMKSGGWRRDSILSNTLEAVIGAIYLDSDFETCRNFICNLYTTLFEHLSLEDTGKDSKTELQEYLQAKKLPLPAYKVIAEDGEAHNRVFTVECQIDSLSHAVSADGKSKRIAEQSAASKALALLESDLQ
jgi:ribonuclease III